MPQHLRIISRVRTCRQALKINLEGLMSEKIGLEAISRRKMFSLLGLVAAASLAVPATVLTTTEAEAVVGRPLSPGSVAGVARRQNRRNYKKKRKK
jgi:D-alanyl-D-alanine dipeptidase